MTLALPQCKCNAPDFWESTRTVVVGLLLRSVRVFRQFAWLDVGSVNGASPYHTHQYAVEACGA